MTTIHTSALDHAILAAVHHTDAPHADAVRFAVYDRAEDGTPTGYRVTASRNGADFIAHGATPTEALKNAMRLLYAEAGHGSLRVVDFAAIEIEGGAG